jgi:hypothetical protein
MNIRSKKHIVDQSERGNSHCDRLSAKLAPMHQRVRTFALAILRGESTDPIQSANLLREITALHPDISALVIESSAGWARGAAARTAAVALVAEVSATGALASLPAATLPSLRGALARALANAPGEDSRALRLRLQQHMEAGDTNDALFACHAVDLLTENQRAQDAIEDLEADRRPPCHVRTPIYRSRRAAARNGLRAFLAILIAAILLSLGGWPFASQGLSLTGVFVALSANTPSPRKFAVAAVIALPIAALLAGVTEFLILDGVDQFPLLAIGMAPSVLAGALLFTLPKATTRHNRPPAARLLPRAALAGEPARLQSRSLSVPQLHGDFSGHPDVRRVVDNPPRVRPPSAAVVPDIGTSRAARPTGRSPVPVPR